MLHGKCKRQKSLICTTTEDKLDDIMGKLMDVAGNKAMEIMGKTARQGIDNFMKAFSEDYEIEYIVADLELKPLHSKGTLQVKMRKRK